MSDRTDDLIADWRSRIDARLTRIADSAWELPDELRQPVHYSLTGEGKRLRGLMVMASYQALGGRGEAAGLAAAIEVVHAYSLVHDDLPCMDNDSMRRGRPTTHRAFDVITATVVGVAMVPLAVEQVLRAAAELELAESTARELVGVLMSASGAGGMVGGQLLDLEGEQRALSVDDVERLHRAKTGALISASMLLGARAAGGGGGGADHAVRQLVAAGDALGLAFQIADDVLDATESSEALGKTAGHDAALAKSTYASVLGVPAARERRDQLVTEAMDRLESAGLRTPPLERLARFIAARRS